MGNTADGTPVLWLGDIGDNSATASGAYLPFPGTHPDSRIKRSRLHATITVKYADEPYNAEAPIVSPSPAGRIWIGTKREQPRVRTTSSPPGMGRLKDGDGPAHGFTGACSPQTRHTRRTGSIYVIRTYRWHAAVPGRAAREDPVELDIGFRGQGEAITYSYDSRFLYAISEGEDNPLMKIPLP